MITSRKTATRPIREWLDGLPPDDRATIDYRLMQMEAMEIAQWSDKWVSKYRGTDLFELRISGNKVQYRPLGVYFGKGRFVILAGAIERNDKLKRSYVETAQSRHSNLQRDPSHAQFHQFDDPEDLDEV